MSRPLHNPVAAVARPRGRPRKDVAPAVRFAPIRLADVAGPGREAAPMHAALELLFPDGLRLRVTRDADPAVVERLAVHLRRCAD